MIESIPSPPASWASFQIWIFTVHSYALCILAGIIVGLIITSRRLTARGAQPGVVVDFAIVAVPLAIVGARAYHVLTHPGDYFGAGHTFYDVIAIWNGGNAIFGSLIGGAVGIWIASRWTGVRFLSFADAMAPGLLVAQGIGRIGNWFNTELYGMPTTLPWGLQVPSDNAAFPAGLAPGTLFHPTFLYELIWDVAGAIVLVAIEKKLVRPANGRPYLAPRIPMRWGRALAFYFIWYGAGRSVFESIRIDPSEVFFGLRTNVWAAFLSIVIGIVLMAWSFRRHPGLEVGVYRPGRQWVPDGLVGSRWTAADFPSSPADEDARSVTSGGASRG
ncbi:MAG TPA: prolipoprotein diacylglyceryl transferase [Amnibacterium sp.]|uniref:prolipoprotein diacylglyceryl transferase n=1 Tax=Amnibacterium sp. TaxID=1872496 RepID=UPI002F95E05C